MSQRASEQSNSSAPERIIRIHGTFSHQDDDRGTSWWQLPPEEGDAHPFWTGFLSQLPPSIVADDQVFHWTGENSEGDRQVAAAALLDRLEALEQEGAQYHLVAHSHGGSVVWATLSLACERKVELSGLRSWTTVGTPFLKFQRGGFSTAFLVLVFPLALCMIAALLWWAADFRTRLVEHVGQIVEKNGWPVVAAVAACIAAAIAFCVWTFLQRRLRKRSAYERAAGRKYGARWLGLNSSDDEAINALKAALRTRRFLWRWNRAQAAPSHPNVTQVPGFVAKRKHPQKPPPSDREVVRNFLAGILGLAVIIALIVFLPTDWAERLIRSVPTIMGPIGAAFLAVLAVAIRRAYNRFAAPLLDAVVHRRLAAWVHGNDTDAFRVVAVSTSPPVGPASDDCPTLPQQIDHMLVDRANQHFANTLTSVRRALVYQATIGSSSLDGAFKETGFSLKSEELVHTSYFEYPEVIQFIQAHIAEASADPALVPKSHTVMNWIKAFKAGVPIGKGLGPPTRRSARA